MTATCSSTDSSPAISFPSCGVVHEIIVQTVRERTLAVCGWADEVLRNPPRFVAELAIEGPDLFPPILAMIGLNSQDILAEPSQ